MEEQRRVVGDEEEVVEDVKNWSKKDADILTQFNLITADDRYYKGAEDELKHPITMFLLNESCKMKKDTILID